MDFRLLHSVPALQPEQDIPVSPLYVYEMGEQI